MSTKSLKQTPAAGGYLYNPADPPIDPSKPPLFRVPYEGGFGQRTRDYHIGIDYAAEAGRAIPAASSGEVIYSGPSKGFHYAIVVRSKMSGGSEDGKPRYYYSIYGHVDPKDALPPGTQISAGQIVGNVGIVHEGEASDGPHVHFSIVTQDAINAYNQANGTNFQMSSGKKGGIGISTGLTSLFVNPDEFTEYADGAPYNALTYVPIGSARKPRPVPHLAQTQEAEGLVSQQNPANPAGLSAAELDRFYAATGHPAADQREAIANGTLRVTAPDSVAKGPSATGFPRRNTSPPLYLDATRAAQGLFTQVQPSDVPRFPLQTIPESTPGFPNPQRVPILPAPQRDKRSEAPDGSSPAFAQTSLTTPTVRPDGVYSAAGNFFPALPGGQAVAAGISPTSAGSSEPGTIADGAPVRYLSRRAGTQSHVPSVDEAAASIGADEDVGSRRAYDIRERQAEPYSAATSGAWSLPEMPQSTKLAGLVSGEPMAFHPVPQPIFFPEAVKRDDEEWLVKLLADRYRG